MSYQLTTTAEGLRLASVHLPHAQTVSIAVTVDVGARWESPAQHGLSHLLEHMAFKGTKTRSAQDIAEAFDAVGAIFNAYTSHEHTVYHVKLLKEDWLLAAEILCDILQDSVFDEAELAREQQVILQELAMVNDTPDEVVFDQFQGAAFGKEQALGRTILGTQESITSFNRDDVCDYVKTHYQPRRMVISAAGDITHDAFTKAVSERLQLPDTPPHSMPSARYTGGRHCDEKAIEQLHVMLGVNGVTLDDDGFYASQCLAQLLGGGTSSRLFQEVREKRGLVYNIHAMAASYVDCGVFMVSAATSPQDVDALMPVILDQLQEVARTVTAQELQRAKRQQIASIRMGSENTVGVAEWIGRDLTYFNMFRDMTAQQAAYEAVDVDQVKALAERLFAQPQWSVAALGPQAKVVSEAVI